MGDFLFSYETSSVNSDELSMKNNDEFSFLDDSFSSPAFPNSEIPDDLQNFDINEFLNLQPDITGSQIDVDILLQKQQSAQYTPRVSNFETQKDELSPSSDDSGFITPNNTENVQNLCEMTSFDPTFNVEVNNSNFSQHENILSQHQLSPVISYAVTSENRPHLLEPITIGPINDCDFQLTNQNPGENLSANHNSPTDNNPANQSSVGEQIQYDSDFDFLDGMDDDEDQLADNVLFSGSSTTTLPTSYTSAKRGASSGIFESNQLTNEERILLSQEGVRLPEDLPLTKMEERILKKVRRKIRNRQSAHTSRQKKKDYIQKLETRVKKCTDSNSQLQIQVEKLEKQNSTLMQQLTHLKSIISQKLPNGVKNTVNYSTNNNATIGTCLMMVIFGCFLVIPNSELSNTMTNSAEYHKMNSVVSRTLLSNDDLTSDEQGFLHLTKTKANQNHLETELSAEKLVSEADNLETVSRTRETIEKYDDLISSKESSFGEKHSNLANYSNFEKTQDLTNHRDL